MTPTWTILVQREHPNPKLLWNRVGVMSTKTCNISEKVQDRTKTNASKFTAASRGPPCDSTAFLYDCM